MKKSAVQKSAAAKAPPKRAASPAVGVGMAQVRALAKTLGVPSFGKSKKDLIRAIQLAEGNFDCYGTAVAGYCDQKGCAWYNDCLAASVQSGK